MPKRQPPPATHADERWLLTYADMITLLVALFIVLWAMSSVNVSKFEEVKLSFAEAFSNKIHTGGSSVMETGGETPAPTPWSEPMKPEPAPIPLTAAPHDGDNKASAVEQEDFRELKAELDREVEKLGLENKIETAVDSRGLAIKLKTDGLLFASGSADLQAGAVSVLQKVGGVLAHDSGHDLRVEGHTDNVPVSGAYPSNWELSTARASAVVRALLAGGIDEKRFSAAGFADLHPLEKNVTDAGRAENRRVEIILPRHNPEPRPETPGQAMDKLFKDPTSTATEGHR